MVSYFSFATLAKVRAARLHRESMLKKSKLSLINVMSSRIQAILREHGVSEFSRSTSSANYFPQRL